MKKHTLFILLSLFTTFSLLSCKCHKKVEKSENQKINTSPSMVRVIAPVIIYKTNSDFFKNVPVILNDEKTDIVSFPDITDVFYKGQLAYPSRLENGYLLDNRGIGKNVAFLKYTYEEYSKLSATPTKEKLLEMIISKDPLTELYKCEKLPKKDIQILNDAIKKGLPNVCENLIK